MNPHSIAAKHRDPKPELRPSSSRTVPPEEGPIHVTSRQPSAHPQAPCRPSVPPGTSWGWGAVTLTKAPLVSSSLNSRGEETHRPSRAAEDDHLSRPGLCPGFKMESGVSGETGESAPHAPVRECGPPSCGEGLDCARRERAGPPQCPDARVGSPALDLRPWGSPA